MYRVRATTATQEDPRGRPLLPFLPAPISILQVLLIILANDCGNPSLLRKERDTRRETNGPTGRENGILTGAEGAEINHN